MHGKKVSCLISVTLSFDLLRTFCFSQSDILHFFRTLSVTAIDDGLIPEDPIREAEIEECIRIEQARVDALVAGKRREQAEMRKAREAAARAKADQLHRKQRIAETSKSVCENSTLDVEQATDLVEETVKLSTDSMKGSTS